MRRETLSRQRKSLRFVADRFFRRILPRSLLGRSLLIVLIPLFVTQIISLQLFYGTYLNVVSRRLASSVAGEINQTLNVFNYVQDETVRKQILSSPSLFSSKMAWLPGAKLAQIGTRHSLGLLGPTDHDLVRALKKQPDLPFFIDWKYSPQVVRIEIQTLQGVLQLDLPSKKLHIVPVWLFMAWAVGSSVLLFILASLFMRNQVRTVTRLAAAARLFGIGRDPGYIQPKGAREVRSAALAFNQMRERIQRFVSQRTAILAAVSHDLRTPLTRLRLGLEMIPKKGHLHASQLQDDVNDMVMDLAEMERMIEGYLAFARGEGEEKVTLTDLNQLVREIAIVSQRAGINISIDKENILPYLQLRQDSIRRVLNNLINNAIRYSKSVKISLIHHQQKIHIFVDDDGQGIPPEERDGVFNPFATGFNGGIGLGLTISRDILHAHGGDIVLQDSPMGGLRVKIELPV